jgi:putative membrane protein
MTTTTTDRRLATIVLAALGVLLVAPLFFMGVGTMGFGMVGFGPMMGGMWGTGTTTAGTVPGWMFLVSAAIQLLFLAILVGAGYLVYRAFAGSEDGDPAFEELRLAYARGDLDDEEYERRRDALER